MIEAASLRSRCGMRGPDQPHGVHEVDVEAGQPVLLGVRDRQRADVGHDDVEPAERLRGLLHPGGQRVAVADVDAPCPVTVPRVAAAPPRSRRPRRRSRAQKPTTAPSSRKASTMARPMPRVPPVTRTRLPVSCRSMAWPSVEWAVDGVRRCRASGRGRAGRRGCRRTRRRPGAATWPP